MGSAEAGEYLSRLLSEHPDRRKRWEAEVLRPRGGALDVAAICRVLGAYLWDTGEVSESVSDLPRRLRDRVGKGLRGELLSAATVNQLAGAFGFSASERQAVLRLLDGREGATAVIGAGVLPKSALPPHQHRTVALHEHHYLGEDGLPSRHRTLHVIESQVDGLAVHRLLVDTRSAAVEILQGGRVGAEIDGLPEGLFGFAIELSRPLRRGETATLEYEIFFRYDTPPEPEFRRAVNSRSDNVDIRVQFDPAKLPTAVYWSRWETLDSVPEDDPVRMDPDHSVHKWLPYMQGTCVGFRWSFS